MLNLSNELLMLRKAAPPRTRVLTVQMFGINRYDALKNLDGDEWQSIICTAGFNKNYIGELWRGFCLSQYVSVRNTSQPVGFKRLGKIVSDYDEDRLRSDLKIIERSTSERALTICTILFGIRYSDLLRGTSGEYKHGLLTSAGIKPSFANDLRKGTKLAGYVSFERYPSDELDSLMERGKVGFAETNRNRISADRRFDELRAIIEPMMGEGLSLAEIVRRLNQMEIKPLRGQRFHYSQIHKLVARFS